MEARGAMVRLMTKAVTMRQVSWLQNLSNLRGVETKTEDLLSECCGQFSKKKKVLSYVKAHQVICRS